VVTKAVCCATVSLAVGDGALDGVDIVVAESEDIQRGWIDGMTCRAVQAELSPGSSKRRDVVLRRAPPAEKITRRPAVVRPWR
jgi:hypothetical protein